MAKKDKADKEQQAATTDGNVADNPDIVAGGGPDAGLGIEQGPNTSADILYPGPSEDELKSKSGGKIERMTMNAWWCPNCDNANERSLSSCGKCGAEVSKDGKSVGKAKRTG